MGWRSLGSFFALNSSMVGLLTMVIFVGMGEKLAERFLPVYLMALGGGTLAVGLLNGLDNLLSALYSFPGGYVSDRLGTKRALVVFNLLAMGGFLVVILVPSWQAVILGSVLFLSWTSLSLPATMSLVAKVLPSNKRTMGVSMHSLFRRIPMALGPMVGGLCIDAFGEVAGVRWAFGGALIMAAVALGAQQRLIADDAADARKGPWIPPREMISLMDPALKNLLLADILVRFCEQIPYAFVVLWCMKDISSPVSAFQFGILTAVEMAVAMLIYVPVAWMADRGGKKPFVVATFCFFTVFPVVLFLSRSFWLLVLAFGVRGLKEFGEPTRKALIMDLAPEGQKAAMFGTYYLIRDLVVSVAAFGGAFLWAVSPALNFFVAALCGAAGTFWFARHGQDLEGRKGEA